MLTRLLFVAFMVMLGASVLVEVVLSRQNTRRLLELGGRTFGSHQTRAYLFLAMLWAVGAIGEVLILERSAHLVLAVIGLSIVLLGRHLRRLARGALGQRWTLDVVSLPGNPLVTGQIYDRMRHPEYTGTFLVFLGAPLLHGAWLTFGLTALVGATLLVLRVRLEENVLDEDARYLSLLGDRPRFYPRQPSHGGGEPSRPTRLRPRGRRGDQPGRA